MPVPTRRSFLAAASVAGAAVSLPGTAQATSRTTPPRDPFTLGVASGDPSPDGFVLWTRLAVDPLAPDGKGGMPDHGTPVEWRVCSDEALTKEVRRGVADALPEWGHSVHVEVSGLEPGRDYWYHFKSGTHVSQNGRTRTSPAASQSHVPALVGVASCSHFEQGHFTAYRRLAEERPDLVLHLGDYIYETPPSAHGVRRHVGRETRTLADYRLRYAQYRTDPDLRAAHAAAPWAVVWDDHELENNWAGGGQRASHPAFASRREVAFRAYYENMPLRANAVPRGPDLLLYRRLEWGDLASFHLIDTRQYRSDQTCAGSAIWCAADDPARTITGQEQERWLVDGFRKSRARWDLIGQQVFFGQRDSAPGPRRKVRKDSWDGYPASRMRVTRGWMEAGVRNVIVLTGDAHAHWAADIRLDYDNPFSPVVGAELVTTSISSDGDGADTVPAMHPLFWNNPHLRFYNGQRGYIMLKITQEAVTADFKVLPYVRRPGAPVHTRARFVVRDRVPGLRQVPLAAAQPTLP
ncbi:alkaline phosphatase D family protein [Sinosporangium siamense]|uniref:Alkaline phosphatase n=1 Tax=Sinosporangium siamense TaxID=1367973 RepID=A0A919RNQ1_9ACTN|nr:alkaline phosphatase D family protein [Sinosporangium siamense]GII95349.1 alkaline phosphatase [Sinosporangium siamense]